MSINAMNVEFYGEGHLAETLRAAASLRGLGVDLEWRNFDLVVAAEDVVDHEELLAAEDAFMRARDNTCPVVLASQVPPGTTRRWAGDHAHRVFYQVDTIIVSRAVARAAAPEQFVVGCADPSAPLPLAYQQYLAAHGGFGRCPVLQMSYESAEVAKLAINYVLSKQIEAANDISAACAKVRADYDDVRRAMHNDARIGPLAYLRPGKTNQHLQRDVDTVLRLRQQAELGEN